MKILMINSVCGIRSTGRICTDLATILEDQGHEVKIAYGREYVPEQFQKYAVRIGSNKDVWLHGIKSRLFDAAGFGSTKATEKFIEWIKQYNPDVIHLHNIHGYYINIELLFEYLAKANKPVIWTLHDCWALTGHCSHFSVMQCEQWKTHCLHCKALSEYPTCYLKGNVKNNYKRKKELFTIIKNMTIVTPSKWLEQVVGYSFLNGYDVQVIPNGIDLDAFKPTTSEFKKKYGLENKRIILGVATSWSDKKGLKEFTQLANILEDDYKIVLVGLTKKQIRDLPDEILAIPRTNNCMELAEIYTAADYFVNAGKEETMGLTTVEAMACGTPVIVSNLTAVPEVVTYEGGLVLGELSAKEIKRTIELADTMTFSPLINACRYEKNVQYGKYITLYEHLVASIHF